MLSDFIFYIHLRLIISLYMWTLTFYSHMEYTCMIASFHWEGRLGTIKLV